MRTYDENVNRAENPPYLQPYTRAVKQHGADFRALLWASPATQAARFEALVRMQDPSGLTVLDLGCGKADLLEWLIINGMTPRRYIGIEAVAELAEAAEFRRLDGARIVRADFLREPKRMMVHADVVYLSGSLNTIEDSQFYPALASAFASAGKAMVFNFLCSPILAGASYLRWRAVKDVLAFARTLGAEVAQDCSYIDGDCTIAMWKSGVAKS